MEMTNYNLENYSKEEKKCIKVMINILDNHGISKTDYSVNGFSDDKVCLEKKRSSWLVYNGDRGRKFALNEYPSIYRACSRMICKLADSEEAEIAMQEEFRSRNKMPRSVMDTQLSPSASVACIMPMMTTDELLGEKRMVKKIGRSAIRGRIDSGTSTVKRSKVKIAKKYR